MFLYHSVQSEVEKKVHRSREPYLKLKPSQRAAEHGINATIHYFSQRIQDIELKETTVRTINYTTERKCSEDSRIVL